MRLLTLALAALLCSCALQQDIVGTGPVTLTVQQQAGFERWRTSTAPPLHFFLAGNGRYYYTFCPAAVAGQCSGADAYEWQSVCEKRFGSCKLYAEFGEVVWRGKVTAPTVARDQVSPPRYEKRPLAAKWEGVTEMIAGTVEYENGMPNGRVRLTIPGIQTKCAGTYQVQRGGKGTWSLACNDGQSASGTLQTHGRWRGSSGTGKDTKGRRLEFTVGAKPGI